MKYRVLPYRAGSRSASALAAALGGRVLRLSGSAWVPKPDDIVINWGRTNHAEYPTLLNFGPIVHRVSNKRTFFESMAESEGGRPAWLPPFWLSAGEIPVDSFPVVCRTVLAGHSGDGIVIARSPDEIVQAGLYVKYIKKEQEYRVHIGNRDSIASIIAVQRKARRLDVPDSGVNWQVRNHHNGFIYAREGFVAPTSVLNAALDALGRSGLDFGAVDVILTKKGKPYVLEINTAPGLEGQTVEDYAAFFQSLNSS